MLRAAIPGRRLSDNPNPPDLTFFSLRRDMQASSIRTKEIIAALHRRLDSVVIMATRGVMQLTKLRLVYSEYGGSSEALRQFIASGKVIDWARTHPHVHVSVEIANGKHPLVEGEYRSGFPKQVSVRNESIKRVETVMNMLHNSSGRKMTKLKKPVISATPSVQGVWTPMLNLNETPFQVTIVED